MAENMMENRTKYDAVIIGFGKGGKTMAGALGAAGKKVALIEKSDRMYGGTCINVGCIPTKSLVYRAGLQLPREVPLRRRLTPIKPLWNRRKT